MTSPTTRDFWLAQLLGWGLFALANGLVQGLMDVPIQLVWLNSVSASLCGLLVSSVYRWCIRRVDWSAWRLGPVLTVVLAAPLLLTLLWNGLLGGLFLWLTDIGERIWPQLLPNVFNGYLLFLIWHLIYFFFQYFVRYRQAEVERYRAEAAEREAQLQALESQLNPHFMFNTLNNIRSLVREDATKARHMLGNFSALLRYALHHARQPTVPVEDELDIVQQYLELMAIHYDARLRYHFDVSPDLPEAHLPPMLIQTLVENAIKHGISRLPGGGTLRISLRAVQDRLHLTVRNTGQLSLAHTDSGTGLAMLRERLTLLYGSQTQLTLRQAAQEVVAEAMWPLR